MGRVFSFPDLISFLKDRDSVSGYLAPYRFVTQMWKLRQRCVASSCPSFQQLLALLPVCPWSYVVRQVQERSWGAVRKGDDPPEPEQVWEDCASCRLENMASLLALHGTTGTRVDVTGCSS